MVLNFTVSMSMGEHNRKLSQLSSASTYTDRLGAEQQTIIISPHHHVASSKPTIYPFSLECLHTLALAWIWGEGGVAAKEEHGSVVSGSAIVVGKHINKGECKCLVQS